MGISSIFRSLFWRVALALLMLGLAGAPQHASAASNCTVAANGAMYRTIQAAVNDTNCSTIDVAAGTYTENVTIGRDVTITGSTIGSTIVDGNNAGSVFSIPEGTVTLDRLTIQHGLATDGGGIASQSTLTVQHSTLMTNHATRFGGGIFSQGGALSVYNTTISNNWTDVFGGGIFFNSWDSYALVVANSTISNNTAVNQDSNYSSDGGGIFAQGSSLGSVTVTNSTISGNTTGFDGGGILALLPMTVTNSTVSSNNARSNGGGIFAALPTTVTNSTISGNRAGSDGGGFYTYDTLILVNTLVASSSGGDCYNRTEGSTNGRNSLIEDVEHACGLANGVNGNIVGQDPQLGPLQDNGGPTQTHALLTGSPAIDRANAADCQSTDQRGTTRPQGTGCDIGAYEFQKAYAWSGFKQPIDNLPTVNSAKAGSAVPVKFSLGGNQGLAIFAAGSPASQKIACNSAAPLDEIEQTATAGASSLQYDAASDTYTYVWKTDKSWAGSCRQLTVTLIDGTVHTAAFKFK